MVWIIILALLALSVIFGLAFYATRLLKALKQQQGMIAQAKAARCNRLKESIEIIGKAMQSGECNHSEGVIRLAMLLMPFGKNLQPYPAMMQLHKIVRDMPTHENYKQLEKKARMRLDLERKSAEIKFEQDIIKEIRQLLDDIKQFGEF